MTGTTDGNDGLPEGPPWFLFDEPVDWNQEGTPPNAIDLPWVQQVVEALPRTSGHGPLAIAIFGPWGSGKTTILRCFENMVGAADNTVWFEPWRYEREADLMIPLLAEMTAALAKHPGDRARRDILKAGQKLLGRAIKFSARAGIDWAVAASGAGALVSSMGGDPAKIGEKMIGAFLDVSGSFNKQYESETKAFRENFKELIGASEPAFKPVHIFIDDLDRCSHGQVLRLLEAIKNFLWEPGVVFVLALDHEQVTQAIAASLTERFHGSDDAMADARVLATRYLEKFFIHAFDIEHTFPGYENKVVVQRGKMACEVISALGENAGLCNTHKNFIGTVFAHCPANMRKIKRIARWIYFECRHEAHSKQTFKPALAEFAMSELHAELWLGAFAGQSLHRRARLHGFINAAVNAVRDPKDENLFLPKSVREAAKILKAVEQGNIPDPPIRAGVNMTPNNNEDRDELNFFNTIMDIAGTPAGRYFRKLIANGEDRVAGGLGKLAVEAMGIDKVFGVE